MAATKTMKSGDSSASTWGRLPRWIRVLFLGLIATVIVLSVVLVQQTRSSSCDEFKARVNGYAQGLIDAGVERQDVAPRTSERFADQQPEGCDYI